MLRRKLKKKNFVFVLFKYGFCLILLLIVFASSFEKAVSNDRSLLNYE